MKKVFILMLSILISMSSFAQESAKGQEYAAPGGLIIGGNLSFNSNSSKYSGSGGSSSSDPTYNQFAILPTTMYVLNRMLALGLTLGYTGSATKTQEEGMEDEMFDIKNSQGQFIIQPQLAYYVHVMARFYVFATLYVGMGFGNSTSEYLDYDFNANQYFVNSYKNKLSSFQVGLAFSFMYYLSNQWAMALHYGNISYRTSTETDNENSDNKWTSNQFAFDFSLATIQIGIYYYLLSKSQR